MSHRLDTEALGLAAVTLALDFPRWVQRRVQGFTFIDDTTVRIRTSVTLRWPEPTFFTLDARPVRGETIYVPLDILEKRPLTRFDLTSSDGRAVAVLPTKRNGDLAAAGLIGATWAVAERRGRDGLTDGSVDRLEAIVPGRPEEATKLLDVLDDGSSELGDVLQRRDQLRALTVDLARNFLLLVPATYYPGHEEVVKYSESRPLPWKHSVRNLAARCGLADFEVEFGRLPLGFSESYHFQVAAPDEVVLSRARLSGSYQLPDAADAERRVTVSLDEDGDSPAVNLHARRPSEALFAAAIMSGRKPDMPPWAPLQDALAAARESQATETQRSDRGFAFVRFRPELAGTFAGAWITSILTAVALVVARGRLAEIDGQAGSAILLALPVLAAGYLGRPGEHAFAARLLAGVRFTTLLVGVCSLVVASLLSGGFVVDPPSGDAYLPDAGQCVADVVTTVAVLSAILLTAGVVRTYVARRATRD